MVSRGCCSGCTGVKEGAFTASVGVNSSVSDAGTSKSLVTSSSGSEFTEDWMDNRSSSDWSRSTTSLGSELDTKPFLTSVPNIASYGDR